MMGIILTIDDKRLAQSPKQINGVEKIGGQPKKNSVNPIHRRGAARSIRAPPEPIFHGAIKSERIKIFSKFKKICYPGSLFYFH